MEKEKNRGYGRGVNPVAALSWILSLFSAASLPPFFPQICTVAFAGTGLMRCVAEQEAYRYNSFVSEVS